MSFEVLISLNLLAKIIKPHEAAFRPHSEAIVLCNVESRKLYIYFFCNALANNKIAGTVYNTFGRQSQITRLIILAGG